MKLKYTIFSTRILPPSTSQVSPLQKWQCAIQGCNAPSRKCTAYSQRIQPIFVQYSLQSIISFERSSNCAEHAINLSNMCLYFQSYSTQFTAESRVVFKMHDPLKKMFKIQQSFREVHFSSCSCAFRHKVYWFPANVLFFSTRQRL